jgi:hypothetical protein
MTMNKRPINDQIAFLAEPKRAPVRSRGSLTITSVLAHLELASSNGKAPAQRL